MVDSNNLPSPTVSIVVINYNGRPFVEELLATLQSQTYRDFEISFIDNHSTDDSPDWVENIFPEIRLRRLPDNVGFARAGNLGAREASSKYLVFLNVDLKLDPDWLGEMVATIEHDDAVAAVAPKMRLYDQPHLLNGVGGAMNYLGYTWDRGMFEEDLGQYDRSEPILFASAGASLFRRSTFLSAGGFDERFFMYHEDVDLGWRLWLLGHRILTSPNSIVYHHFGASTRAARSMNWREVLGERNNIRTLVKNYQASNCFVALRDMLLLRQSTARKLAQLKNFLWNLLWLPETLQRRRFVQSRRVRSDGDLDYLIVQSKDVPVRV
jgi:GT2 family glycosyltransferase